jgi:hypothetical protein
MREERLRRRLILPALEKNRVTCNVRRGAIPDADENSDSMRGHDIKDVVQVSNPDSNYVT